MLCQTPTITILPLIALLVTSPALAGKVMVDFRKPVYLRAFSKVCESDDELEAMVKGAPANCYAVKADLPLIVIDTHLTGFLGGGTMHVKARSPALATSNDFYINAEDLKN